MKTARRFWIEGIVQGVGFRYYTYRMARELGIHGYVRNLPDGRVEVYAEGSLEQLDRFRQTLAQGPPAAVVERVVEEPVEPAGTWTAFEIRW